MIFLAFFGSSLLAATNAIISGSAAFRRLRTGQDLWVPVPPCSQAAVAGAQLILNLSASNDYLFKHEYRKSLVSATASRLYAAYVYASCAEGESTQDLVWSGASLICENGSLLAEAERFTRGSRSIVTSTVASSSRIQREP